MKKLKIISKVRINGELIPQEEIPKNEFQRLLEARLKEVMGNIGFEMKGTA